MSTLLLFSVLVGLGFAIRYVLHMRLPRMEKRHYEILVQQAGGDAALADRLIEYEFRRSPETTRIKAIQTAIWRLDRDRN